MTRTVQSALKISSPGSRISGNRKFMTQQFEFWILAGDSRNVKGSHSGAFPLLLCKDNPAEQIRRILRDNGYLRKGWVFFRYGGSHPDDLADWQCKSGYQWDRCVPA